MLRNNELSFQITEIWSAIGGPRLTENECNNSLPYVRFIFSYGSFRNFFYAIIFLLLSQRHDFNPFLSKRFPIDE